MPAGLLETEDHWECAQKWEMMSRVCGEAILFCKTGLTRSRYQVAQIR